MFSEQAPPHALEAEQAVIGACLASPIGRMTCVQQLKPADFYSERHSRIFAAIVAVDAAGPLDPIMVADQLSAQGQLDDCGGLSYLMSCIHICPTPNAPEALVNLVKDKAARRRLITSLTRARTIAQDESRPMDEAQAEAEGLVLGAREPTVDDIDPEDWADEVETEAALVEAGQDGRRRVWTGYRYLDLMLRLWPKKQTILAGGTSQGKSATAIAIVLGALRKGHRVYLWSGEMDKTEIWSRMAAAELGIPYEAIQDRRMTRDQVQRFKAFMTWIKRQPLTIRDKPMTIADIRADCRYIAATEGPIDLILVDYLLLLADLNAEVEGSDRRDVRIGRTVWNGRQMAFELDAHVIMLHQLNRENSKRTTSRPRLSDLKESSTIEQHADAVGFVYRPERDESLDDDERERYLRRLEIIIAKQRAGKVGSVWFDFNGDLQKMTTLHPHEWPRRAEPKRKKGAGA